MEAEEEVGLPQRFSYRLAVFGKELARKIGERTFVTIDEKRVIASLFYYLHNPANPSAESTPDS